MTTRTVTGTLVNEAGSPLSGFIKFDLLLPLRSSSSRRPDAPILVALDENGSFSVDLEVPETGTAKYEVTTPDDLVYRIFLPSGSSTSLTSMLKPNSLDEKVAVKTVEENYEILSTDQIIRCTAAITVTLPAATGSRKIYAIYNTTSDAEVTIATTGDDTVNDTDPEVIASNSHSTYLDGSVGNWDS